jgi:hypothetical protein
MTADSTPNRILDDFFVVSIANNSRRLPAPGVVVNLDYSELS